MKSVMSWLTIVSGLAAPIGLDLVRAQEGERGVDVDVQPGKVEVDVDRTARQGENVTTQAWRATKVIGLAVRNAANEDLGKIEDLVIDLDNGDVRYAALSFGGFLGIGDKLFAVPWQALEIRHDDGESFGVLNIDKDRLKNAPGFQSDKWPDFASPRFSQEIDDFYRPQRGARLPRGR